MGYGIRGAVSGRDPPRRGRPRTNQEETGSGLARMGALAGALPTMRRRPHSIIRSAYVHLPCMDSSWLALSQVRADSEPIAWSDQHDRMMH